MKVSFSKGKTLKRGHVRITEVGLSFIFDLFYIFGFRVRV